MIMEIITMVVIGIYIFRLGLSIIISHDRLATLQARAREDQQPETSALFQSVPSA
jgi:hypothetical protein